MVPDISWCHCSVNIQFVEGGLDLSEEYPIEQPGCGLVCVFESFSAKEGCRECVHVFICTYACARLCTHMWVIKPFNI